MQIIVSLHNTYQNSCQKLSLQRQALKERQRQDLKRREQARWTSWQKSIERWNNNTTKRDEKIERFIYDLLLLPMNQPTYILWNVISSMDTVCVGNTDFKIKCNDRRFVFRNKIEINALSEFHGFIGLDLICWTPIVCAPRLLITCAVILQACAIQFNKCFSNFSAVQQWTTWYILVHLPQNTFAPLITVSFFRQVR